MRTCWYCGTSDPDATYEWEHQLPRSLGSGRGVDNIVDSCRSCDRLKINHTAEQFHLKIECRLATVSIVETLRLEQRRGCP